MFKSILVGLAWLAVALAPASPRAHAQQISATRIVLAAVTDSNNRAIVDLGPDDFLIQEEDEEREVLGVYIADYPVVIVLDNSSAAQRDLPSLRAAATGFVRRIGQRPTALVTLSDPPAVLASFADSQADVLDRIRDLTIRSTTTLKPIEAVAAAVAAIRMTNAFFSAIVVVSTHGVQAAPPASPEPLRDIFSSGTVVHAISRGIPPTAPRGRGSRPAPDGDVLRHLTDQTGGRFTTVFAAASYSVALDQLADRLATEMMIQYLVPDANAGREVRVGVRVPGARVHGLGITR